nr:hypothetical protein [uncultured Rhodopila sp.]
MREGDEEGDGTQHPELSRLNYRLQEERRERTKLEAELVKLYQEVKELTERGEAVYVRTPAMVTEAQQKHENLERLLVLAGRSDQDPLWRTVLSYADEHERNERQAGLRPGLSDGERHYEAGRAASASDFASALRDLKLKAELEARKVARAEK